VCYLILPKGKQKMMETCFMIDQQLELIDPRLQSGTATPVEKVPCDADDSRKPVGGGPQQPRM